MKARAMLNRRVCKLVEPAPPHLRKLAICGGGPLLVNDLDELRAWDGDIWAINHTAAWLVKNGVNATFITVDPILTEVEPVDNALIALCAHPHLFECFKGRNVLGFDLFETGTKDDVIGGASTATRAPALALRMGYVDISFFGCEGSYESNTHVDRHANEPYALIVRAGGKDYKVEVALFNQCREFMTLFPRFGWIFKNRSHGLLRAMMENEDTWEVVGVSAKLKELIESEQGPTGIYDKPYEPLRQAA